MPVLVLVLADVLVLITHANERGLPRDWPDVFLRIARRTAKKPDAPPSSEAAPRVS